MAAQRGRTTTTVRRQRRKKRRPIGRIFFVFLLVLLAVSGGLYLTLYGPTGEEMALDEYYSFLHDDEAALVINDIYMKPPEGAAGGMALVRDGELYVERGCFKDSIDDGYVFDDVEKIMRYATDDTLISVPYGSSSYTEDGTPGDYSAPIIISDYDNVYLAAGFAANYSDFTSSLFEKPYRAVLYKGGFEKKTATVKWRAALRRLGGPKSKVLEDLKRNTKVSVIKNYGSWSNVVSEDGVIGFVRNRQISKVRKEEVKPRLPERKHDHKTFPGRITLGWHQVTSKMANNGIDRMLRQDYSLDVISPTWFYLSDSEGGLADFSSSEYVDKCHSRDVQVWGLVSDFEQPGVDEVSVLNRVSYRDKVVKHLISSALACGMDGINVDFEKVPLEAADGYVQMIRELSQKCEANDLFLSVDNYVLASFNGYYNRMEQADYADYVIVMAYDEHYRGDDEAGSNASLPFVREGIEATLTEVPKERLVLGMPFYCREWIESRDGLTSKDLRMRDVLGYLQKHSLTPAWDESIGQNYVEYTEDGEKHMLWIEDTQSLERKLNLMKEFDLAGGAFWKLGSESEDVWPLIGKYR